MDTRPEEWQVVLVSARTGTSVGFLRLRRAADAHPYAQNLRTGDIEKPLIPCRKLCNNKESRSFDQRKAETYGKEILRK